MAEINIKTTISEIYKAYEDNADDGFREHLGASIIGRECLKSLWFSFRWCTPADFSGRILRLFQRGHRAEDIFIADLRSVGVQVWNVDPRTNKQFNIRFHGGHFGGSLDAILKGLIEAPKSTHVGEFKTHNDKSYKLLTKQGVEESKYEHFTQMQIYMHGSDQLGGKKIKRSYYMAENKNNDDLHGTRTKYNKDVALMLVDKAKRVIEAPEPLTGISDNPTFYKCKLCDHQEICHYDKVPAVNCRTCTHSTPHIDTGTWTCHAFNTTLDKAQQLRGCKSHLFNPSLISYGDLVSCDETGAAPHWISYNHKSTGVQFKNVVDSYQSNDKDNYSSSELNALDHNLIGDSTIHDIKQTFEQATIIK